MAILIMNPKDHQKKRYNTKDPQIIEIFLRYISRTRAMDKYPPLYVGYLGFKPYSTIEEIIAEFHLTQKVFNRETGIRARHEIYSFVEAEVKDPCGINRVKEIAYCLARWYYEQGFQVVFAIHNDSGAQHIHYVINAVSFITGKKYHCSKQDALRQRRFLLDTMTYYSGRDPGTPYPCTIIDSEDELDYSLIQSVSGLNAATFAYQGTPQLIY